MSYLKVDKLQLDVIINGDSSRKELLQLEESSKRLAKELKKLPEGTDEFIKKSEELKKVTSRMDEIKKEIGLTGATMKELQQRQKELNQIMRNIDPRLPVYKELQAELNQVKNRIRELNGTAQSTGLSFGKMADGFNKYFALVTAAAASLTGLVLGLKSAKKAFDDFEQSKANLSALTGLEGKDLEWFGEQAKKMGTETQESGIRITKSATDILRAYTLMGSAKPELLKNKEALNEVTKQALILAEASQMETEPAVLALATSMNQFGAKADQARRFINVLAAGAKEGATEVPELTESLIKSGAAATAANISFEQTVGMLEALGEKGIKGELAGTGLKTFLIKLQMGADATNPKIVGLNKALENLANQNLNASQMQEKFGLETYVVAQNMINQVKRTEELTEAVTGTSTAYEMAAKTTGTAKAEMAQALNRFQLVAIELGEKLTPAITGATNFTGKFMKATVALIDVMEKHKGVIVGLAGMVIALMWAKIRATAASAGHSVATMYNNMVTGIGTIITERYKIAVTEASLAQKAAAVTTYLWSTAVQSFGGPIGIAIAGISALIMGISMFNSSSEKFEEKQSDVSKAIDESTGPIIKEQLELKTLVSHITSLNSKNTDRKRLLDDLVKKYPDFLGNLNKETVTNSELTKQLEKVNEQYENKIKLAATSAEKEVLMKRATDLQLQMNPTEDIIKDLQKRIDVLNSIKTKLRDDQKKEITELEHNIVNLKNNLINPKNELDKIINDIKKLDDDADKILNSSKKDVKGPHVLSEDEQKKIDDFKKVYDKWLEDRLQANMDEQEKEVRQMDLKYEELIKKAKEVGHDTAKIKDEWGKEGLAITQKYFAKNIEDQKKHDDEVRKEEEKENKDEMDSRLKLLQNGYDSIYLEENNKFLEKMKSAKGNHDEEMRIRKEFNKEIEQLNLSLLLAEKAAVKQAAKDKIITKEEEVEKLKTITDKMVQLGLIEIKSDLKTKESLKDLAEASAIAASKSVESALLGAKSLEDAGKRTIEAIRQEIKVFLAKAIALELINTLEITGPLGLVLAPVAGAAVVALFDSLVPQFYKGNIDVIGGSDGRRYSAYAGGMAMNPTIVSGPTLMRSMNGNQYLAGERMPEIIIDGPRSRNIMLNYPQLFEAIRSVPQYGNGNVGASSGGGIFVDPEMLKAIKTLNNHLGSSNFLVFHREYNRFKDKVSKVEGNFGTKVN